MSAVVRLSSKLPGNAEINGLDSLHESLTDNPEQVVAAIVWLDVPEVRRNTETGEEIPTVRIRKIDPIGTADKVPPAVIELYEHLLEKRLNRTPLPFTQLDSAYEHVDERRADGADELALVEDGE